MTTPQVTTPQEKKKLPFPSLFISPRGPASQSCFFFYQRLKRVRNALLSFFLGMVLGHEITGEVIECGADVEYINNGDLVSVPFNIACGRYGSLIFFREPLTCSCL